MARRYFDPRLLPFLLFDVHDLPSLLQTDHFGHLDAESVQMMLDAAKQLADTYMFPHYEAMDRDEPQLTNGTITVHESVRPYLDAMGEAGWIGVSAPLELGGMQAPAMVSACSNFIYSAANNGAVQLTGLTQAAANLLITFGTAAQKQTYLPNMFAGKWQGTMALTEPQAGSSLADVTTSATPIEGDRYRIRGQKIYISGGDYTEAENVVHFLLARIDGAPAGTKGISLFLVPKLRPENGNWVANDVTTAGLYHKMGQKGTPATHLMYGEQDNCIGYLLGETHQGLRYMFQMMNEARIAVGIGAAGVASAAYQASLQFAQERPQGRLPQQRDPSQPQVPIIQHPDVRRMLLFQKAMVEGCMALGMQAAKYEDQSKTAEGDAAHRAHTLLSLLTPILKTYASEMAQQSISQGVQILGGGGYCKDFPLENYYRDIRIYAIYEGTSGIQAQDLLGRKVTMENGLALQLLQEEIQVAISEAQTYESLQPYAANLSDALGRVGKVTQHLLRYAQQGDVQRFLSDANLYLDMAGILVVAWQWLRMGTVAQTKLLAGASGSEADFLESKLHTMRYYFHYEVPKMLGLAYRLQDNVPITLPQQTEELAW